PPSDANRALHSFPTRRSSDLKWLKISRLIKRRTIAQMACEQGRVYVNDRPAKAGLTVKSGDKVHIELGSRAITIQIESVPTKARSEEHTSELQSPCNLVCRLL